MTSLARGLQQNNSHTSLFSSSHSSVPFPSLFKAVTNPHFAQLQSTLQEECHLRSRLIQAAFGQTLNKVTDEEIGFEILSEILNSADAKSQPVCDISLTMEFNNNWENDTGHPESVRGDIMEKLLEKLDEQLSKHCEGLKKRIPHKKRPTDSEKPTTVNQIKKGKQYEKQLFQDMNNGLRHWLSENYKNNLYPCQEVVVGLSEVYDCEVRHVQRWFAKERIRRKKSNWRDRCSL